MAKQRTAGRTSPLDADARERLKEAQAAESRAVAVVYTADDSLVAAITRRDEIIAAASVAVISAERDVVRARAELVTVSGLDRAAMLLGASKTDLRRAVNATQQTQTSSPPSPPDLRVGRIQEAQTP